MPSPGPSAQSATTTTASAVASGLCTQRGHQLDRQQRQVQRVQRCRRQHHQGDHGSDLHLRHHRQRPHAGVRSAIRASSPPTTISFNLAPGKTLADATAAIDAAVQRIHLPISVHGAFAGSASALQSTVASEAVLIVAALGAIYIVLGILYESTVHPLTILSTLPSAGVGAVRRACCCPARNSASSR